MIGAAFRQLIGLFVDDERLAVAILVVVGLVSVVRFSGAGPAWLAGLLLTIALPAALVLSVLRGARRALRRE